MTTLDPAHPDSNAEAPQPIDLVRELREALGLPSSALPISPKQAWEEALVHARGMAEGRCSACMRREGRSGAGSRWVTRSNLCADGCGRLAETERPTAAEREAYQRGRTQALTELRDWLYSHQHKRVSVAKWSAFMDVAAQISRQVGSKTSTPELVCSDHATLEDR